MQAISAQCLDPFNAGLPGPNFLSEGFAMNGPGMFGPGMSPLNGYASLTGVNPANLGASFGGGLAVTSSSPIAPTGLSVTSENAIEGALAVAGNLPFLGTVAVEGAYQTAGAGAVSYGCGNGNIGITGENIAPAAAGMAPAQFAPNGIPANQFAPNGLIPNQFTPNGMGPAQFAPNGMGPGYGPGYGWGAGGLY